MPVLRLFFYFEMGKAVYDFDVFYKKSHKNTCLVIIFVFVMEKGLFVIIYNSKFH